MSSLPRIAHVVSPLSWRGGEQQAVYLYEELAKLGVYQIFVCAKGSVAEKYCRENGFRYYSFKKRLSVDPVFAYNLSQVCKKEKIDFLHPHDSAAHTFSILSVDLFGNPASIVLQRRVDFPISRTFFSRYKYNHPRIKKILCVSEAIRQVMLPDIRRKELLTVVYEGINPDKFVLPPQDTLRKEFSIPAGLPIVANVAALSQQKDYFIFIDTVELLLSRGIKAAFFAIGTGPQETEIKAYARERKMDQHIHFTGFRTDIPLILPQIDVLLFSSETEGLGTTILDCYAAEVPIVSTDAGGIPELIIPMETGYLGKVKDPASLAKGVEMMLSDETFRTKCIRGGRERLKLFTRDITAINTLKEYQKII